MQEKKINIDLKKIHQISTFFEFFLHQTKNFFIVGGFVRDFIIFNEIKKDIDIATDLEPEDVLKLLEQYSKINKGKIVTIGKEYGSIMFFLQDYSFEITTFRKDIQTDGRKAVVMYSKKIEDDCERRDFTINCLYLSYEGVVYDFHNSLEHIKNKKIIFIGDAQTRIKEDYLRILRYFRFCSYLNYETEESTLLAIKKNIKNIKVLSKERITKEFLLTMQNIKNLKILVKMNEVGLLNSIFKGKHFDTVSFENLYTNCKNINISSTILLIIISICINDFNLQNYLSVTKKDNEILQFISKNWHDFNKQPTSDFLISISSFKHNLIDVFYIFNNEQKANLICQQIQQIKLFNIDFNDLQSIFTNFDKTKTKYTVNLAKKIFIENNFKLSKQEVLMILKNNKF